MRTLTAVADVVGGDLIDRIPVVGGAGVLVVIIGVVTRLWLGSESRHRAELERIGAAHVAEVRRYEEQVAGLRAEVREVRAQLEEERRLRWRAQDVAAERRRRHDDRGQRDGS